ncbi:hypothetical protein B0T24DRAFT_230395 [Lasiosphaeria ovina]|uniref:Secreted protein n=1 Tax=Lasiosphaeria ovina TaxID=92902 RepID=A0AAE0NAJ1_9PEZI|nr:hypothetical protein B0T24DRAFT_230395 [Lasiosphaeria ovina]
MPPGHLIVVTLTLRWAVLTRAGLLPPPVFGGAFTACSPVCSRWSRSWVVPGDPRRVVPAAPYIRAHPDGHHWDMDRCERPGQPTDQLNVRQAAVEPVKRYAPMENRRRGDCRMDVPVGTVVSSFVGVSARRPPKIYGSLFVSQA